MKRSKLFSCFLIFLSSVVCLASETEKINNNLNNYTISDSYSDTLLFRGNDVYSISCYKIATDKKSASQPQLVSYTEYLRDKRKRYNQYFRDDKEVIEKFYYDNDFKNLVLKEWIGNYGQNYYNWLTYNNEGYLTEDIDYNYKNNSYVSYTKYNINKSADNKTIRIDIANYTNDTLPDPIQQYTFTYPYLTKKCPQYQSKSQKFELINGFYKLIEVDSYVIDDRSVYYTYDKNGFIKSEIWYKPKGRLENKTEYSYSADYRERIEQRYHLLGTEKSLKTIRQYNEFGDITLEYAFEYTGNRLGSDIYVYKYDEKGNWTERKKYYQPFENGMESDVKELVSHELREIKYYDDNQQCRRLELPSFSQEVENIRHIIPVRAEEKQRLVEEYVEAIREGNYETTITKKKASDIHDFTPKYWEIIDLVYGDLDGIEGDEAVAVYNLPSSYEDVKDRQLAIYKKENDKWVLWHQTHTLVMDSRAGGMMGDPYVGTKIVRKCIVIEHFGGSRLKWSYIHRFRFQNGDWYLIGATTKGGGTCDYFDEFDYNLSTGVAVAKYYQEECDNSGNGVKKAGWTVKLNLSKALPRMHDFNPGSIEVKIPNKDYSMYY